MEREIYMSNLPDLNQLLHNKKKKYDVAPLSHSRVNLFGWQRWRQLCTCTTNTMGFFVPKESLEKKKRFIV